MLQNNRISRQIEDYIAYKQSLGYLIKIESQELRRFANYTMEIEHEGSLTSELAVQWASLNSNYSRKYMARRLETIHTFAVYISSFDCESQIPPTGLFGRAHMRSNPYIYTNDEVESLMDHALMLYSPDGIRATTVSTAIGLLYSTGIRVSELTCLKLRDADLKEGYIFINNSKFKKDRIVPLHPSVMFKLKEYQSLIQGKIGGRSQDDYFFVSSYGKRFNTRSFEYAFKQIRPLALNQVSKQPRLYDLRHTFACNTIKRWYAMGEDVNQRIFLLSTYMGHVKPEDTYWYLSATPELLAIASRKFENRFGGDVL